MQKEDIGTAWNLVADLGNGRQLSVMFNMATGVTKDEMNAEVDKLRSVLDRQQAKSAILGATMDVENQELRYKDAAQDLADIDAKHTAKGSLSAQERSQREVAVKTIETMKKNIDYKKGVLEKLKQEAV